MIVRRAYFREILLHFAFVLGGVLFLLALGAAVRASATAQGAPLWVALALVPLMVGNALPYFFPVTLATSVVLTYGRMAADGEEMALRSAGIHPMRLAQPALMAGLLLAVVSYPATSVVLPKVFHAMRSMTQQAQLATLENTNPGASALHFRGMHLLWKSRGEQGAFRDVLLTLDGRLDPSARGGLRVRADEARMDLIEEQLVFRFEGMRTFSESDGDSAWSSRNSGTTYLRVNLEELSAESTLPSHLVKIFTSGELREKLRTEKIKPDLARRYRFILWQRWAMAFASLPVALLGALLGWRLRKGGFLTAFSAALGALLMVYYPLHYLGESLSQLGNLSPFLAAWLPTLGLAGLVGGLYAWRKG